MAAVSEPTVVAAVPETLMQEFFSAEDRKRLAEVSQQLGGTFVRLDQLSELPDLSTVRVVITSWGAPPIDAPLLAALPSLELVAHTGASIRALVTDALWDRGVAVTQAGAAMARAVAEVSLAFTLALLHRIPQMHDALRRTSVWWEPTGVQHEIFGAPIAVIGASRTGRSYLELIRALGAQPMLVDPTLTAAQAEALGAPLVSLEEALTRASITALHAPTLPETHHLIGAAQLALMPDGAGLVNTARSWLVDESALLTELESGRLSAAIDVFDEEPLAPGSPFRSVPGVLLTPHRAAGTHEGRLRQGRIVADELAAFAGGQPLQHTVTRERLAVMG
ncbi:hydroxyacid dehydrogenase [Microbacterium sp.]|uniref:hydroxyacid dehydrogenase n=1 Tax=Microbacterium sp. TaxID=51671 RepID=UPI0028122485|nr:hydroxyacid dehydrogenase [Microbacterium sp.]